MPARNDSKAVQAAAHTVDRDAIASLLRDALTKRLPKVPVRKARTVRVYNSEMMRYEDRVVVAEDDRIVVPMEVPRADRSRKRSRVDYATKQRIVELKPYGKWPRYGTARAAKTEVVRNRLKERTEAEQVTKVANLLGLTYEWEGKVGSITFHDLEVMADKYFIVIKEGE